MFVYYLPLPTFVSPEAIDKVGTDYHRSTRIELPRCSYKLPEGSSLKLSPTLTYHHRSRKLQLIKATPLKSAHCVGVRGFPVFPVHCTDPFTIDAMKATTTSVETANGSATRRKAEGKTLTEVEPANATTAQKLRASPQKKYRHVAAVHSKTRPSCLSHDSDAAPSFVGFRNLMVIVLGECRC